MLEKYDSLFILKFTFHWVSYFYLLNLATQTLRDLVYWTELVVEVLEAGGRPKKTRGGWKGEASRMVGMAHQPSFRLPQSPTGGQRAHSKPKEKPLPQPPGEQQPEDTQVSREQGTEVTGPPKAEGRGGRRAREILLLPGWRSIKEKSAFILPESYTASGKGSVIFFKVLFVYILYIDKSCFAAMKTKMKNLKYILSRFFFF